MDCLSPSKLKNAYSIDLICTRQLHRTQDVFLGACFLHRLTIFESLINERWGRGQERTVCSGAVARTMGTTST